MGQDSSRETPLFKQQKSEKGHRSNAVARSNFGEWTKAEAVRTEAKAAAEALVLLDRVVTAARARRSLPLNVEKQDPFEAWYGRYLKQQKARREGKRQEVALGLGVTATVVLVMSYLTIMGMLVHRYPSGWELIPMLFGGLAGFSLLFYRVLRRRSEK